MNIIETLSSVALYLLTAPVTTPFDRAVLTFSNVGDAFAVDNVTFSANKASEEGQTLILLSAGVSLLLFLRGRRREFRFSYH